MFQWYREATVCYAFLLDVSDSIDKQRGGITRFERSDWFTRGWTLQELLAPCDLRFFDCHWRQIGTKSSRSSEICTATGVERRYLNCNFQGACLAVKLSWVAGRTTEYREDMAYCMFGILGIQMDVRYGEGENAFLRLQEQLVKKFLRESIFAWTIDSMALDAAGCEPSFGLLAPWPSCFRQCGHMTIDCPKLYRPRNGAGYAVVRQGIQFETPGRLRGNGHDVEWNILRANHGLSYDLGLNCWIKDREQEGSVTLHLSKPEKGGWRRTNVERMILDKKLKRSFKHMFPKTRPHWIQQNPNVEDCWGKLLADLNDERIEDARRGQ